MLNERETILALEEAMRNNRRFWERQGYDEREAFIKALNEVAEMLRFKHYWSMCNTKEEKEEHFNTDSMQYDPESIFPESKTIKTEPSEEFKRLANSL